MRPDTELGGLVVQDTRRHCGVLWYIDQVIDIRNGPNPQTSTALQNLVQTFTSSGPEDYDNAVSIQLFEVHILYGCYICIVTLVSE